MQMHHGIIMLTKELRQLRTDILFRGNHKTPTLFCNSKNSILPGQHSEDLVITRLHIYFQQIRAVFLDVCFQLCKRTAGNQSSFYINAHTVAHLLDLLQLMG